MTTKPMTDEEAVEVMRTVQRQHSAAGPRYAAAAAGGFSLVAISTKLTPEQHGRFRDALDREGRSAGGILADLAVRWTDAILGER